MTFASIIKHGQKIASDNSPVLLTAVGVVGTVTTAVLTGRSTIKAVALLDEANAERLLHEKHRSEFSNKEQIKLVWKCYAPPVVVGGMTISAIIFANHIGSKRAAAVAAAYGISEKAFSEYKEKVVEKFGQHKEQAVRDELAQDRVTRQPPGENLIVVAGGNVLCYDAYSGRYFKSDMESLKQAQNDTNYKIIHESYQSLSDLYLRIGLPATTASEVVGWNSDRMLELSFSGTLTDKNEPCMVMDFRYPPMPDFHKLI